MGVVGGDMLVQFAAFQDGTGVTDKIIFSCPNSHNHNSHYPLIVLAEGTMSFGNNKPLPI